MKNLKSVIRSRASRFVSLRVVLILSAVMVLAGFGVASAWNGEFQFLNIDEASAQTPESPQVATISNYAFSTASGVALEDMTGSIQLLGASVDDTASAVTNIGFDFFFMGVRYAQFSASSNGLVSFGATTSSSAANDLATANPKAAAYWDDLCTSATGKVHYKVVGSAPSRKIVVEFQNMRTYSAGCTAGTLLGNYQVWLYESVHTTTPGVVQFVYGAIPVNPNVNSGYTVGISSSATSFASVTTATDTNSFAASNNTQTVAITAGKSYLYTPPLTNGDPTNLTFTNITASTVTLNWVDNSTNEAGFPIYISSDGGTTYTFIGTAPENATSIGITGLAPGTTYFFRVYAVTEGALSTGFAQNSVTTNPPISGTKTIGPGGDYTTFAAAISDANAGTGAGGVTFNVTAGVTFPENGTCITGGSSTNPIIFQKSGAGANPIIQPPGSASPQDSGICILGGDFITFDGIDVAVAGGNTTVEYGALVFNLTATNGAQNNTIKNSKITLNRTNTSSIGIAQLFSIAASAASGTQSTNKYYNLTIENASRGILLNGSAITAGNYDTNNEIGVTGGGTTTIGAATANDIGNGTAATYGIQALQQFGVKIFNTEVRNVTGTGTSAVDGILLGNTGGTTTSVGTNQIYNNKIHDLRNTSTGAGRVTGIRDNLTNNAGSISQIYNNFIWNLDTASTTPTLASAGLNVVGIFAQAAGSAAASTHNIQFNSVRIQAITGTSANSTAFEIGTSTPIFKVQNNIFANFTGTQTGTAKHYAWVSTSSTAIGGAGTVSDNNVLHIANPANGFVGLGSTTDRTTLIDWQAQLAGAGPDDVSRSQNPMFVSGTDLHIQTGVPTPVEGTGITIAGLTTDIDGDTRLSPPDIGADEGAFTTLFANDIAANAILVPAPGAIVPTGATVTPQATFENHGTANQTNVPVQFTITGPGGYSYASTPQNIATLNAGVSQNVSFNSAPAFSTPGVYTMTATANLVGDSFTANDSVMGNFTVFAVITGGTVNVGTGETYTSLTNPGGIFDGINNGVAASNITVDITSDLTGETGAIALNQVASPFTVTIKPSGAARTISGSAAVALIKLNGADNVTIDGSLAGGTDRSLTITNTNNATGTAAIWLSSLGTGVGATNDTIKNCNVSCGAPQNTGSNDSFGIIASGTSISTSTDGADNDTLNITNNAITKVKYGVYLRGSSTNSNDNNVISQNLIGPAALGVDEIGRAGIVVQYQNAVSIDRNEVRFVGRVFADVGSFGDKTGIGLGDFNYTPTATTITNSSVTRNLIHDIVEEQTYGAIGIVVGGSNTAATNNLVANNMIYNVRSNGTTGDQLTGIAIGAGNGDQVVFNSVYLTGDIDPGLSSSASGSAAGAIISSTPTNLTFKDNILYVDVTSNTSTLKHYALIKSTATYSFGTGGLDFNDYWILAANTQSVLFGNGTSATSVTSVTTLGLWQGETPTHDANSKVVEPVFVSGTDLHLQGTSMLLGMATPIAGITIDFDNDPRDTPPDIGADEVVQGSGGVIPAGNYYNASGAAFGSISGDVIIRGYFTLNGVFRTFLNTLTIDCDGIVTGASNTNYVVGNVKKNYCATGAFIFPVGTDDPSLRVGAGAPACTTFYRPLDSTVTALGTNPSSILVRVDTGTAPSNPQLDANSLQRYWTITETGNVTANLVMHYQDCDVPTSETDWRIFRIEGTNPTSFPNACPASPCVDTGANTATFNGVQNFSKWTVGPPLSPTSAPANVSGHVLDNTGAPLSGVTMTLLDTILVENRTTVTDGGGNYFFDAVLTGRQILVTPAKNGYTFDPSNRAFNHTGDLTNVDFVGTESGQTRSVGSDFDGDGKADLSVFRPSDGTWYTVLSSTGVFKSQQWGVGTDRIVPADYDGDHITDVAVFRPSTGTWYISQSSTSTMRAVNWGLAEDVVTPADFDGDGQADIAVFRPSTGTWYIIDSHNGQTRTVQWGTVGDRPVAADYDGDGKADVAVWRPSNGIWYVTKADGTYTYEHWGIEEDRAVVADYDGDHKADMAVFRPSTATWYVKLSSDGSIDSRGHGTAADILTPGDYDGDGKTDRAVWQTGGDWNILRSGTNTTYGQKWGMTGDIPTTSAYVR